MMTELYPDCTTIPVNEWFLKGMTIFRQAEKIGDCVDKITIIQPLEELYPDLFGNEKKLGEFLW